ncbi:MAG: hypothetical protein SH868_00745 [Bythopirellula sp.]|nr:hypothetical protein [Bythopirellula sp.]
MKNFGIVLHLVILLAVVGCGSSPPPTMMTATQATPSEHGHSSEGPHGGGLIELGNNEYHGEFVHDDAAGTVTIYLLDSVAKASVPIETAEITINLKHEGQGKQFKLAAEADASDPAGKSSRFVSNDVELAKDLDQEGADAQLAVNINGKPYRGAIEHSAVGHGTADHDEAHANTPAAHGGILVSLGQDSYHVEAIVTDSGELQLYTLGSDETRVMDVEIQELVAYVKPTGATDSTSVQLKPQPQPGDTTGKASLFVAQLPDSAVGQNVDVTVPNITIAGERFRFGFSTQTADHGDAAMPDKVADEEEQKLYLTPGGIYTQADIEANGNMTVSEKFKGFMAKHDMHPKPGDKICPVTMTKANPACSWIVGGKTYEFCCPPCVDEFVAWSKSEETAKDILLPEEYVQK